MPTGGESQRALQLDEARADAGLEEERADAELQGDQLFKSRASGRGALETKGSGMFLNLNEAPVLPESCLPGPSGPQAASDSQTLSDSVTPSRMAWPAGEPARKKKN